MKKYVVLDAQGEPQVTRAGGFIPEGALCEAPEAAGPDDGDCITLETYLDESGATCFRALLDEVKLAAKRAAVEALRAQTEINAEAEAYLRATDWLIIREMDSGVPCPAEIRQARAEARERIVR